jgi:hypothetical protein
MKRKKNLSYDYHLVQIHKPAFFCFTYWHFPLGWLSLSLSLIAVMSHSWEGRHFRRLLSTVWPERENGGDASDCLCDYCSLFMRACRGDLLLDVCSDKWDVWVVLSVVILMAEQVQRSDGDEELCASFLWWMMNWNWSEPFTSSIVAHHIVQQSMQTWTHTGWSHRTHILTLSSSSQLSHSSPWTNLSCEWETCKIFFKLIQRLKHSRTFYTEWMHAHMRARINFTHSILLVRARQ